ncbi:hypothetical protein [Dyella silvatica]|uniref:hypothetical protein n=1 Tax=Dyella silvatica TaxID=2992128 RepID=UPI0022569048|nr:hypothetical protein [Dyella silvatica]
MRYLVFFSLWLGFAQAWASPCEAIDRRLSTSQKNVWAPAIAKQLGASSVSVLQSFSKGDWRIIYVDSPISDPPFLFFHGDPRTTHYVDAWAGGATKDEEAEIRSWVNQQVPGIPTELAACFAWHVTKGRDK